MELERVAPELRADMAKVPAMVFESGWRRRLAQGALALMPGSRTDGVRIERIREGGARMRVHRPEVRRLDGALLWIHGGGYVIGRAVQNDLLCGRTARALGIPVIAAEYRVAPHHPFPAAQQDCHAVWHWLLGAAARLGVDPARIAIGGQSAGGGLAAGLIQRLKDEGGVQPAAQWLFCPMLDDRTAARTDLDGLDNFIWNNRQNRFGWRSYLGAEPGAADPPSTAVPARRADLSGLPPAWIGVGNIDLFHDEDMDYARRLEAAGVSVRTLSVPGAPHGFEAWAPDNLVSVRVVADAQLWLEDVLAG